MPETSIPVRAGRDAVWGELIDVERWPEWNPSVTSVKRLDEGPLQVGSRARIKQPKSPAMVWEVTELSAGTSFAWVATSPGLTTTAGHTIDPSAEGSIELRLSIDQRGPLAPLIRLVWDRRTLRYITMEAEGLKRRAESLRS